MFYPSTKSNKDDIDFILALNYSREVMKAYSKSFYFASRILPTEKQYAAFGVYAFSRYADNIVDLPRERKPSELKEEINRLRTEINLIYKYFESQNPALRLFAYSAKKFSIPKKYALELLDGVEMDIDRKDFQTFDELYDYCYKVASTVGLMMTYVLGFKDEKKALKYAESLGIAMQLTNILRDISEDIDEDKFYLPTNELKDFSLTKNHFKEKVFTKEVQEYIRFCVERAEKYYEEGNKGITYLDENSQKGIYAASNIYRGILRKIEKNDYNPFLGRVYLSKKEKLEIIAKGYIF